MLLKQIDGRERVVIEGVSPEIDAGRFPIKRIAGDRVSVEADIFADGHDALRAVLQYREEGTSAWQEALMEFLVNDRWRSSFTVTKLGRYRYTICAWVDSFESWRQGLEKKAAARQEVTVDLITGAEIIEEAATRAAGRDRSSLKEIATKLRDTAKPASARTRLALSKQVTGLMARYPDRSQASNYDKDLTVIVDRERARFSTWYELFPRSTSSRPGQHGTLNDVAAWLPYVAGMGFDVLYLPPIHPIGMTCRKGRNNAETCQPGDPGTPWAIGGAAGSHKAIHTELGTLEDFHNLMATASKHGIELALDIAFQCSPDHPYVTEHPNWFRWRPDGTVQYAENPPKKYQDIYPLNFETDAWRELWAEMKSIFVFWAEQGVRIFRVDNPHTKPFAFWEWVIGELKREYPGLIFLAEAFTRPKVMYRLAKLGFSQSYTYFTWRNEKWELEQYFTELTRTAVSDFFRPNLWPTTPDILSDYLRDGGRPAFLVRLVLAATLGASYGIYGPAYELAENRRRDKTSEEFLDSEKYEIKHWDIGRPDSLKDVIGRINHIRREHPALQDNSRLHFHNTDNELLICYSKHSEDNTNVILVAVNLDCHYPQSGWVNLDLTAIGLDDEVLLEATDLLDGAIYRWQGARNYIELDPVTRPAHIFRLRRKPGTPQAQA